jgi:hypothetical protein
VFGLFPKFSTPVEKTVEIPADQWHCSVSGWNFRGFRRGRNTIEAKNRPFPGLYLGEGLEKGLLGGAKPG